MAKTNLSFQKIVNVPTTGLTVGRIYFETSTGMIKVATSATTVDKFGDGVKSATWDQSAKTLHIINESGHTIDLNLSDVASASSVSKELEKKLNIGSSADLAGTQSYYGLKKDIEAAKSGAISESKSYTDGKIAGLPKATIYKGDGTTITQNSSDDTVTFSVGAIAQDKVTGLTTALNNKASNEALTAVKKTADAAAPKDTVYTKAEVDGKIGSVYKVKGSIKDVTALTALTDVAVGDTYNVTAAGSLNGESFEAGSNFVAIKAGAGNQEGMWDKLGGTINLEPYATKPSVTAEIAAKINTLDKESAVSEHQFATSISEVDGIVTVKGRAIEAGDIPNLSMDKITGLSGALSTKVSTGTTVNSKPLSANVVLAGGDILVGGSSEYSGKNIQAAVESLDSKIKTAAAAGVTSFGGKTGAVTVDTATVTNGQVKFTMADNKLTGTVNGLKSAAYTDSNAYATAAQGKKADSALQSSSIATGSANGTISVNKVDVPVRGLGSAAYAATAAFDAAGAASTAETHAKQYADNLMTWAEFE